jgi:hypothetical protein
MIWNWRLVILAAVEAWREDARASSLFIWISDCL